MELVDGDLAVVNNAGVNGPVIQFFDPYSGAPLRQIPAASNDIEGIAYDGTDLWQLDPGDALYRTNPTDGSIIDVSPNAPPVGSRGMTVSGPGELTIASGAAAGNWWIINYGGGIIESSFDVGNSPNGETMFGIKALDKAVTYHDNAVEAQGTGMAMVTVTVPHGDDPVIVVELGMSGGQDTDINGIKNISLTVDDLHDGVGQNNFTPLYLTTADALNALDLGALDGDFITTNPTGNPFTQFTSAIWVIPVSRFDVDPTYDTMSREFKVTIDGGDTADLVLRAKSFHGVSQTSPAFASATTESTIPSVSSLITLPAGPGQAVVDVLMGREGAVPANPIPGPPILDPNQIEQLAPARFTAQSSITYGVASSYDLNPDDASGMETMQWSFIEGYNASNQVAVTINDCAWELDCQPLQYDGGDAPDSYLTRWESGGPLHGPKGPTIGDTRDAEFNGIPTTNAQGDDDLGPAEDDEDGVTNFATEGVAGAFISKKVGNNEGSVDIQVEGLDVAGGETGYLTVYVDWMRDGTFTEAGDQVLAGVPVTANGTMTYTFPIPTTGEVVPGDSYMRVRLTTAPMAGDPTVLGPGGHANDGEIEDHPIEIVEGTEIHGIKYEDLNANNSLDLPGDVPLKDVKFGLTDLNGNSVQNLLGETVDPVTSDDNGEFWFANLPAGNYRVVELLRETDTDGDGVIDTGQNVNGVFVDQGLRSSETGNRFNVTRDFTGLGQGDCVEADANQWFNYVTGSIHGVKFEDLNADGDWDRPEEPIIEGIEFDLYKFISTVTTTPATTGPPNTTYIWQEVDWATSDDHGEFWFTQLDPGTYEVVEKPGPTDLFPNGYTQTTTNQPTTPPGLNSNPADSDTAFQIESRVEYVWEFGAASRAIDGMGGAKDGTLDKNEQEVGRAKGALKVEYLATPKSDDIDENGNPIEPGNINRDLWFGNLLHGQIDGFKFEDVDRDGNYDPAIDRPLAGVTMTLTGTDLLNNNVDRMTTTDANGDFSFGSVVPGDYSVEESTNTDTNNDGTPDVMQDMVLDTTNRGVVPVTLASGEMENVGDWANYIYGSIHGYKFEDLNADGTFDVGEPDLADIQFDLYKFISTVTTTPATTGPPNVTYVWQEIDWATSDVHGEFWFTQLDPGVYEVVEKPTGDWIQSTLQPTLDPNALNTDPSSSTTAFQITSRVEYVWELGAASRPVDGMGGPLNDKLDPGEYEFGYNKGALKVEHLATPNKNDYYLDESGNKVDIEPGQINRNLWFGNFKNGEINGFKYEDVDKDGNYDPAIDLPLANVTMYLTGTDGMNNAVSRTTTTDANGDFTFADVKPGDYTVGESTTTDTNNDGTPDAMQDMVLDGNTVGVTLTSGETEDISYEWANYVYGSIHGYKFHDLNANGMQDDGEPDLADIQFDLYKFISTVTTTPATTGPPNVTYVWQEIDWATSDVHGEFWFTQLDPGVYEVVEKPEQQPIVDANGNWIQSTLQPTLDPSALNTDPSSSTTAFQITSRVEYVWELGAASRPVDGMGGDENGKLDPSEHEFGYNKGALKVEHLATPADNDTDENGNDIEPGDINRDLWFGNFLNGHISGFKYEDVDRDGSYDPAIDLPLANVTMYLTGTDGMNNAVDRTTTTDANGDFTFADVKPGDYTVGESTTTDTNNDGTPDAMQDMVLDGNTVGVTLTSGETEDITYQWANYVYGSIHGYKFEDLNADGTFDEGEPDLADIQFDLYKFISTVTTTPATTGPPNVTYVWQEIDWATSDVHGEFWFTQLDPGVYEVVEKPTGDWIQSTLQPTLDPNALNTDPSSSTTAFQITSRVEYVWELGAASRPVDGMGGPLNDKLDPGEYEFGYNKGALKVEHLATPNKNDYYLDESGNKVDIEPGQINRNLWFGNFKNGEINGFKYEDVDKDGNYDPAIDLPLANVTMYLTGTDGMNNAVSRTTTTDANGDFTFADVKPGDYTVGESTTTDTNNDGTPDAMQDMVLDGNTVGVTLTSGETEDISYEWANYVYGSIHGYKFHDLNANGMQDDGEPDLADIQFDLYKFISTVTTTPATTGPPNVTYVWQEIDWATSDVHGEFWFTQLDPGVYEVVEKPEQQPIVDANGNWIQSTLQPTLDPSALNTDPSSSTTAFQITSRVEYVWELGAASRPVDGMGGDENGKLDPSEHEFGYNKGALKVEHLATPADNDTDENGNDIEPGDINRDLWFGNFLNGHISGFKYEDVDRDGSYDPAIDLPLANVTMYLTGTDGMNNAVDRTTTTDANGDFTFADVKPGDYTVGESTTTDTNNDGTPDAMQDMVLDGNTVGVTLTSGETEDITYQWANYVYGSIHGYKFEDLNADGTFDEGEPDLADIQFDLYKFISTVTTTPATTGPPNVTYIWQEIDWATSDVHGEFWFTQLDPGVYEVVEKPTGDWIQSTLQPTLDPNALNTDPSSSTTAFQITSRVEYVWELGAASRPVDGMGGPLNDKLDPGEYEFGYNKGALKVEHLATPADNDTDENGNDIEPGDINRDLWFGNFLNGHINGFKYEDVDKDGNYDPAIDLPLANVTMYLTGTDGMNNAVSRTTTTDANGDFTFADVKPGDYTVGESTTTDTNNDGTPDAMQDMVLDGNTVGVTLTSGETEDISYEWANYVYGSIHGYKFHDLNANGMQDDGEPDLADIQFDLYKFISTVTTTPATTGPPNVTYVWQEIDWATSDVHGEFWFTQLDPGVYEVVEKPEQQPIVDANGNWIQSTLQPTLDPSALNTDPSSSTTAFQITSRVEYVWELGAASRPVDGMGGDENGKLDPSEHEFGYNKGALKVEHLATPADNDTDENGNDIEPGDINRDLWFGNFLNGHISGFKYEDVDRDGSYDPAIDLPLANVTMYLTGTDGMNNAVDRTTTTDANGDFTFADVKPGDYTVGESTTTDTNNDGTPDAMQDMVLDGNTVGVTLTSGETEDITYQWANYVYGSIHGYKFEDLNADGTFDEGEPDLADIQFDLYKFISTVTTTPATTGPPNVTYIWQEIDWATSDVHGEFWFTQLDPGVYEVVEKPTGDWIQSTLQPTLDPNALNTDPSSSTTAFQITSRVEYVWELGAASRPVDGMGGPLNDKLDPGEYEFGYNKGALKVEHLATPADNDTDENGNDIEPGDINRDLWFGNFLNGHINGFKYEDVDKDGNYDPAIDLPLANVTMYLTGTDGMNNAVSRTTTTDANGDFTFADVKPGDYTVGESTTTDTNNDGTPDAMQDMVLDGNTVGVTLTSGETEDISYEWANYVYGSIHGYKFHDLNANGMQDDGEPDLADIQFDLYKFISTVTTTPATTGPPNVTYVWQEIDWATSDVHGEFWFTQLDPGVYEVVEKPEQQPIVDANGNWIQSTLQPTLDPSALNTDPSSSTTAFQITSRVEYVWELGAASRPVDGMGGDENGKLDPSEHEFGYNKGALKVEHLATPADNDTDENGNDIEPGDINRDLWFGNFLNGHISGFKYEDVDRDGSYDPAIDLPLANVTMYLTGTDGMNNAVDRTTTTDANGDFTFADVKPGDYTVGESTTTDTNNDGTPDAMQDMVLDGNTVGVTLTSGETEDITYQWANYVYGSIHGYKFHDYNRDGMWDEGEPDLANVRFDLYKFISTVTTTPATTGPPNVTYIWQEIDWATSDVHGEFWFTQLDPGVYEVVEKLFPDNLPLVQTTNQPTLDPNVLNTDPSSSTTAFQIASRVEYVWEFGAASRPVDGMGGPLNGKLDPGENEFGYNKGVLKVEHLATPNKNDYYLDESGNKVDIEPGQINRDLWFGNNYVTGSIHGFKFEDIDGDGIWDQSSPYVQGGAEPGLGNIRIELRDDQGNVAVLADGTLAVTMTEPDGQFWIQDIVPGMYTVHEVLGLSDSNFNGIPDNVEGMEQSTPDGGPVDVGPDEAWVWTPGASAGMGGVEVFEDGNNSNNVNEDLIIGNYVTGSIHGFKFLDLDADGIYEPCECGTGDTPFEWGVFELLDDAGNPVLENGHPVVFTDIDGQFWFTNLAPGLYTLRERPDLTDRNDLDGDGFPDVIDTNGDGFPDQMGNGIPDDQEGLMTSTPDEIDILILSRQEYVWQDGASMLDPIIEVEPDDFDDNEEIDPPPGVVLSVANSDGNVIAGVVKAETPNLNRMTPSTGDLVFGHTAGGTPNDDQWSFEDDRLLRIDFSILVSSVSIDVLGDDSGMDVGAMFAYTSAGDLVDAVISSEIEQHEFETLTVSGDDIAYVIVGGLDAGPTEDTVGLDNLTYEIQLLKEEVNVGTDLMFGNFYAGAIHGLKLQQDTDAPAPNIPIDLVDAWGEVVDSTTTSADGEYWFLDVIPGAYTVTEVETPAIIVMAQPVAVTVGHAQAIFSSDIPVEDRMYYVGLQTPVENHALTLRNLIEGSIHGKVTDQNGNLLEGIEVNLFGNTRGSTETDANGQFDLDGLLPGQYIVMVDGLDPLIVNVDSGEEEVYAPDVAPLDPGQYETENPGLCFEIFVAPTDGPQVTSVKVGSTSWSANFIDFVDPVDGVGYEVPTGIAQLDALPWVNINRVYVTFSEDVTIGGGDISLFGVNLADYGGVCRTTTRPSRRRFRWAARSGPTSCC